MSFWNYLDRLRQEPEEKRRMILWWTTSVITLLIMALWFLSWRFTYSPTVPLESPVASSTSAVVGTTDSETGSRAWADFKLRMIKGWQTLTKTK